MAEHLASIFGTEKDRVNCPFYFKVCVWVVNALFCSSSVWGKKEISISLFSLFSLLSLLSARSSLFLSRYAFSSALSLSLAARETLLFYFFFFFSFSLVANTYDSYKLCVMLNCAQYRLARADTANDALDCTTNQPSRRRFC